MSKRKEEMAKRTRPSLAERLKRALEERIPAERGGAMEYATAKDKAIIEMIEAVIMRPEMYVGKCRLHSAICYLEGFSFGLEMAQAGAEETSAPWSDFTMWLWKRLRPPTGLGSFMILRDACPDEEAAFVKLAAYSAEYLGDRKQKPTHEEPKRGRSSGG